MSITTTPNMGLTKDGVSEYYSVTRVNENSDRIDTYCGQNRSRIAALEASELTMQKIYDALPVDLEPTQAAPVDLDALLTAGVYLVADAAAAAYVTHSPITDDGFYIKVYYLGLVDSTIMRQEIIPISTPYIKCARNYNSVVGWTSWSVVDAEQIAQDRAALVELVDGGAKNRIIFDGAGTSASNVGTSYTSNGITFEVQSDGAIRATGTISSGISYCYLYAGTGRINIIDAFDGKHVLSGNPQGASTSTYRLWYKVGSQTAVSVGDSSVILPAITGETNAVLGLQVDAPQTNLDITFKPMICTKAAWDVSQKYVPYAPTKRELYEMILALQSGGNRSLQTVQAPEEQDDEEQEEMR